MADRHPAAPDRTADPRGRSLGSFILSGARVALAAAGLFAVAECAWLAVSTAQRTGTGDWLLPLLGPVLGKLAVSYALLFGAVMILGAIVLWGLLRCTAAAEPLLAALLVAGAGTLLTPVAFEASFRRLPPLAAGAVIASLIVALGVYFLLRVTQRRIGHARFARSATVLAGLALAITLLSALAFVRSPLLAPGRFRVARAQPQGTVAEGPNVVWIVLDTARADRLSVHGYDAETTPFLEEWSARAIVFDRCIANGMWTVPSHAAMFTGRSVREHGADHQHPWLDDAFVTVAEMLRDAGYRTAQFSNNPWISPAMNLDQGFDTSRVTHYLQRLTRSSLLENLLESWGLQPPLPWWDHDSGAALTNQLIADWLDGQGDRRRPFFLFVNYMEAHLPYDVPAEYRRRFMSAEQVGRSYELRQRACGPITRALDMRFNLQGPDFLPAADREVLKRQYEAAVRYLDDRVREMIRMLDERGQLGNTLVVITSDHGEYLDTHGMWSHRFLTYNDVVHVTLLLHAPGRNRPERIDTPVQLSDLYGTVLHAALGRPAPEAGPEARDLFALAESPGEARTVISECGGPRETTRRRALRQDDPIITHRMQPQIAAQNGQYKLIVSADGQREFYDLRVDPREERNLIDGMPLEAGRLATYVGRWRERIPPYEVPSDEAARELEPGVIEALRGLGYLGD